MRAFKVCHSFTIMDPDSLQNTLALRPHLRATKDTDSHIWFAWRGILHSRETFVLKFFHKWILLRDSESVFEPWSPRWQGCNLITSYFAESTSRSAGAIPLCINSARSPCLESWWLGDTFGSCRRDSNLTQNLSFLAGASITVLVVIWQQNLALSLFFSSTHPNDGQEVFLWIRIRADFFNHKIPNQLYSCKADTEQMKSCAGFLTIPT